MWSSTSTRPSTRCGAASTGSSSATALTDSRGSKYLWRRRPADLTAAQRLVLRALQRRTFKIGRAWALKERFRTFWDYRYPGAARTFFTRWCWRATHSRLKPMATVATLIQRHLPNLLTYLRPRLTNAGFEALNAVIQGIKKRTRGFRNAKHFKTAIHFHSGGLDLYPTRNPVERMYIKGAKS